MQSGTDMSIFIIAEAGVNHNGNLQTAFQMVNAAKEAGADCIKFQTYKTDLLVCRNTRKAEYQIAATGDSSQMSLLKQLELPSEAFLQLKQYCAQKKICFLSTPFDIESIDFLEPFEMPFWKIPSGEITNLPYLIKIAKTKKPVILSTGMSNIQEIREAIHLLRQNGTPNIKLLHCNTEYPTPFEDVNLRAMETMRNTFECEVGYSDHTRGIEVPIAAAALGATIIEKHFTLDRNMEGPDHKASLEPEELVAMIKAIRNIEKALGNGDKEPSKSERKNISIVRKSIVARRGIKKGEVLTEENKKKKRPGNGISPMRWFEIIGSKAIRDYEVDELIEQ